MLTAMTIDSQPLVLGSLVISGTRVSSPPLVPLNTVSESAIDTATRSGYAGPIVNGAPRMYRVSRGLLMGMFGCLVGLLLGTSSKLMNLA